MAGKRKKSKKKLPPALKKRSETVSKCKHTYGKTRHKKKKGGYYVLCTKCGSPKSVKR